MEKIIFGILLFIVTICAIGIFIEDEKSYYEEVVSFNNGNIELVGSLSIPKNNKEHHPCMIFVHGSQGMPRDGYGYFKTYWQEFAKQDFCSLSWDKPGVGKSTGSWYDQSMTDRAEEVLSAIRFLKKRNDIDKTKIGLIGFSQAGWVLPLAASISKDIKFIIPVSGAIDWISQGNLVEENLLKEKGLSKEEIQVALKFRAKVDLLLKKKASYGEYLALINKEAPKSFGKPVDPSNWSFYQKNINTNAKNSIAKTKCPVLAIFGENDAYIDVEESMKVYNFELGANGNKTFMIKLFANADHSMIKSNSKHFVHRGLPMYWNAFKWEVLGKDAFPDGYFETILGWSKKQIHNYRYTHMD